MHIGHTAAPTNNIYRLIIWIDEGAVSNARQTNAQVVAFCQVIFLGTFSYILSTFCFFRAPFLLLSHFLTFHNSIPVF